MDKNISIPEYLKMMQKPTTVPVSKEGIGAMQGKSIKSEEDENNEYLIYRTFNYQLMIVFYLIKGKFKNNITTYQKIEDQVRRKIQSDPSHALKVFAQQTKKHRSILRKCSVENVQKFCQVAR